MNIKSNLITKLMQGILFFSPLIFEFWPQNVWTVIIEEEEEIKMAVGTELLITEPTKCLPYLTIVTYQLQSVVDPPLTLAS